MTKKNYQQLKAELDEILQWFDKPDIEVEQAAEKYKQAAELLSELEQLLDSTEINIKKLAKNK